MLTGKHASHKAIPNTAGMSYMAFQLLGRHIDRNNK